jgi:hypothetical protein
MEIPLAGRNLTVVSTEYSLVLRSDNVFEIQVEGQVDFETLEGDRHSVAFDEDVDLDFDANTFFAGKVDFVSASLTGELTIGMESGNRATVAVDDDFESWTIVGPDGYRVVCMPGGELATWSAK